MPNPSGAPIGLRFELFVDDVEATIRFYSETLGFVPPDDWNPDWYVPLTAGTVTIGVQRPSNLPAGHHFTARGFAGARGVGVEIVIEVPDVDQAYARAMQFAVPNGGAIEELGDRRWGLRDFRLIDPDGYYVRVTSVAQ